MKEYWQNLSLKFTQLSSRELLLIFISGLVVVVMLPLNLMVNGNMALLQKSQLSIETLNKNNKNLKININEMQSALGQDPNAILKSDIAQYEKSLADIDEKLLTLTADLIDPIQMRLALIQLLKLQPGVTLLSLDVVPAQALTFTPVTEQTQQIEQTAQVNTNKAETMSLGLYRHGIKIKLSGRYFQLRDYLLQLEKLPWKFFWHDFVYQLKAYPQSELEIEIYSLSTNQEFLGV